LNHACNVDMCVTDQKDTLSIMIITKRMHIWRGKNNENRKNDGLESTDMIPGKGFPPQSFLGWPGGEERKNAMTACCFVVSMHNRRMDGTINFTFQTPLFLFFYLFSLIVCLWLGPPSKNNLSPIQKPSKDTNELGLCKSVAGQVSKKVILFISGRAWTCPAIWGKDGFSIPTRWSRICMGSTVNFLSSRMSIAENSVLGPTLTLTFHYHHLAYSCFFMRMN
jgi:hypothetical protein